MESTLTKRFKALAKLLALTLLLTAGQAQAAIGVISLIGVGIATFTSLYGSLETYKYVTGYEDPNAPSKEEDSTGSLSSENEKGAVGGDNNDREGLPRSTENTNTFTDVPLSSTAKANVAPTASTDAPLSGVTDSGPTQNPALNQTPEKRKASIKEHYSSSREFSDIHNALDGEEDQKAMRKDISDRMSEERERCAKIKAQQEKERQNIKSAQKKVDQDQAERETQYLEEKTEQEARDQENTDFNQKMTGWLRPQSPLSKEDLRKREKLEQEKVQRSEEGRKRKEKEEARNEANKSFFDKIQNKFKQPQTPVPGKTEEEEEPENLPEDESNEDFINRTEEFEDELNDEDEKNRDDDKGKVRTRKPDTVPKLHSSAETHLQGARALAHGSALMTMETMSGFRNTMGLYRSGRAFSFGTASLDNVSTRELLVSNDPVHQVPAFNREVGSWHNFVQVHGIKANRNQVTGLPGGSISGQGMTAGVFYQLNAELVTGMLLSAHKNTYSFNDGPGSGSLENVRTGPFLSWTQSGFHLDASLTLAHNNYSLKRKDSADNALKASFSGHEVAAYTGMGYDIHMDSWAQGLILTPMAELLYVRSRNGGYTEEGKSDEAMSVNNGSGSQLITRYGLEASYLFPDLESPTELKARLGRQRHNMASQNTAYSLQGGDSGSLSIPAFAEDATLVGLGFYRKVSDYSHISFNYNGARSENGLSHGLQLSFQSKF